LQATNAGPGANPNRTIFDPCDSLWHVVTSDLGLSQRTDPTGVSMTKRLHLWRDVIAPAQEHGVSPQDLARVLQLMDALTGPLAE
jgi:hypothetical protein